MNKRNRYPRKVLPVCPKCGMDSGRRAVSESVPEKFFVVCDSCGHHTKPHANQSAATLEWSGGKGNG